MTNDIDAHGELGGLLVTYRMAIYLGGVAIVGLPLALNSATGMMVPVSARAAITVATVALMTATYVAERRLGGVSNVDSDTPESADSGPTDADYPFRTRIAVGAAVLGLAAGVYVGLEVSAVAGLVFVAGAYLFASLAYEGDGGDR